MQTFANEQFRPVAYVTMKDSPARERIVAVLEGEGWVVIQQPTGFHLLQAISGVIEGDHTWLRPGLIVIDAHARGCAGTTIALGLRELGVWIPIVLVAAPGDMLPVSSDQTLRIVDSASAEAVVVELSRGQSWRARASPAVDRGRSARPHFMLSASPESREACSEARPIVS